MVSMDAINFNNVANNSQLDTAKQVDTVVKQSVPVQEKPKFEFSTNQKENEPISEQAFIGAIERANKALMSSNTELQFSVHEGTKEIMVKVVDKGTNEVVREIPSEKILDMVANMIEMSGILVDERR